jgi:beta-glucanase (GH16 family)
MSDFDQVQARMDTIDRRITNLEGGEAPPSPGSLFHDDYSSYNFDLYQTHYHWPAWGLYGSNHEAEAYTDNVGPNSCVYVQDGALHLVADLARNRPSLNNRGMPYVSGMITTAPPAAWTSRTPPGYRGFDFLYGSVRGLIQCPRGRGLWPGFWLLATDRSWPPEIDIMETFGATNGHGEGGSNKVHWALQEAAGDWAAVNGDIYADYCEYRVDWTPGHLVWYFNGTKIGETTKNVPSKPMFLIVDLAVGDSQSWPGGMDDTALPATLKVKSITVSKL